MKREWRRLRVALCLGAAFALHWGLARTLAGRDVLAAILDGGNLAWLGPLGALLLLRLLLVFVLPPWLLWRAAQLFGGREPSRNSRRAATEPPSAAAQGDGAPHDP